MMLPMVPMMTKQQADFLQSMALREEQALGGPHAEAGHTLTLLANGELVRVPDSDDPESLKPSLGLSSEEEGQDVSEVLS
jgi:hypothetical protein